MKTNKEIKFLNIEEKKDNITLNKYHTVEDFDIFLSLTYKLSTREEIKLFGEYLGNRYSITIVGKYNSFFNYIEIDNKYYSVEQTYISNNKTTYIVKEVVLNVKKSN